MKQLTDEDTQSELLHPTDNGNNINATKQHRDYSSIIDKNEIQKKKRIKYGIIGAIILIIIILAIVLPLTLKKKGGDNPPGPIPPISGHYNPYSTKSAKNLQSNFSAVLQAANSYDDQLHLQSLNRIMPVNKDGTKKLGVDSRAIPKGKNNNFAQQLNVQMDLITWRVAHLSISDASKNSYSIPEIAVPKPKGDNSMRLDMLGLSFKQDPFSITFIDPVNPDNVFLTTENQSLVLMDKFIQMDFQLPSQRLYGFGERVHDFQLQEGTWTMWAIGLDSPVDDGTGRKGTYGVHPFILVQTQTKGDYIGIFFRNSNAQSPVIKYTEDGKSILSYITLGGQIEVYFFVHGPAKQIVTQYQNMFGKPNLPPFWSLGWQQASWKYLNSTMVEDVIDKYYANGMPLETVYLDIPYMSGYSDFTVNQTAFPKINELADRLHKANQRLVLIIDAAISADDINGTYYKKGNDDDIFIKSTMYTSGKYNNNLISKVWPERAVFVDWFNDKCMNMWSQGLYDLYQKVNYDGIWIDMNEPTTFNHGEIKVEDAKPVKNEQSRLLLADDGNVTYDWYYEFKDQSEKNTFKIPFIPGYKPSDDGHPTAYTGNFDYMTLSLNSSIPSLNETTYNVHSLYGHMMANRTHRHLTSNQHAKPDDRPFILTRSSFASTGRFASHWLGDNWRKWEYMRYSIAGIMNMNMFGIPQAGADVCGFFGLKKDDEMCARWIQLATFYPLARAHQNLTYMDNESERSEPYYLAGKFKDWARYSIRDRYHYLRHMYTCLYEVNQNGGSCFDPLFFHFPHDDNVYNDTTSTFMVGNAIKVSPVLDKLADGINTFKSYFPKGNWVSLNNLAQVVKSAGEMKDLPADQPTVHAHLKPGSLVAYQQLTNQQGSQIMTTAELITQPIALIVNRDENGYSYGSVLLDTGSRLSEITENEYEYYQIHHQQKSLQFMLTGGQRGQQNAFLDQIVIANAEDLKYTSFACYMDAQKNFHDLRPKYDDITNSVYITTNGQVKYSDILNVYYGSQKDNDLNLCSPLTYQYTYANTTYVADLNWNNLTIELKHVAGVLPNIEVKLRVILNDIVNVKWSWKLDKDGKPPAGFRMPAEVPNDLINTDVPFASTKLKDFLVIQNNPFQVTFKYRSSSMPSNVLTIKGMVFDQFFNQINVQVQTEAGANFKGIMGLGERANVDFFLKDGVYGMWSRDQPTPDEKGTLPGANMYGTHPFFMYKHKAGAWVGVHYKLAHAQDWWVKNNQQTGTVDISTIATGGVADIYVMQSQTPDDIVNKYFRIIGRPVMVPQWALGWNQCRWGYDNLDKLKNVVTGYDSNKIPLDVQWSDIDWMNKYRTFEYDQVNFKGLPAYVDSLHAANRYYVPIVDAGLAYRPKSDYTAFLEAEKQGLFTKINNETFIGQVWPNDAAYPDYTNPDTVTWFKSHLGQVHDTIKFDGLWEDMNEASNFCNGACYPSQKLDNPIKHSLRYTPTGRDLETKSMPLDTTHANGLLQLDTHNYYGTQEVKATHEWFTENKMRTFIIERSSFAGMGKFSSRWLGDNFSDQKFMGYSISGIMMMNIYGITFAGSDICGFIGDTNPELCARWHFVGAYYPFSRNHNNWGQIPQEPWAWGNLEYEPGKKYIDIFRDAIKLKYSLIRYYYTQLYRVSFQNRGTLFRPMFFEFPEDQNTYLNITQNVMLGDALKVSFNSEYQSQNVTQFYFPVGVWCDIVRKGLGVHTCLESTGQFYNMSTKAYETYLHLRNGYIVPWQDTSVLDFKTSKDLQDQPIELHVLGDPTTGPQGYIYWESRGTYVNDDGLVLDVINNYNGYNFVARADIGNLTLTIIPTYTASNYMDKFEKGCSAVNQNDYLQRVYFYYAAAFQLTTDYNVFVTYYNVAGQTPMGIASYDSATDRLKYEFKSSQCMNKIQSLTFQKITPKIE